MCLPRYRRMPAHEYQLRFNDPDGQILPLLWLGGSVLCLWFAIGTAAIVAVLAWDLLLGLGVGLAGAVLGILCTSFLGIAFPQLDARYLRLGPLAAAIEFLTLFAGAIAVVVVGLYALLGQQPDIVAMAPATIVPPAAGDETDLFDVLRPVAATLFLLGLVVTVGGGLISRLR